jgi:RND family efflux transporter MFP subunit
MSATRQIAFSVLLLIVILGSWFAYERGLFGGRISSVTATQSATGGSAGTAQQGQQANRQNGSGGNAGGGTFGGGRGGAVQVVTAAVDIDTSGLEVRAVGTVAASKAVTLYPEVTGLVTDVAFKPGGPVTEGQALLRLDDADQQIAVEKAKIALADAQAALDRSNQLAKSSNITTVALSDAKTTVQKAEIDLRSAESDLAKRTLHAPFAGTIGLSDLTVGDLVNSQKPIATLDDMSTVTVAFAVPERASGLVAIGNDVSGTTDALAGQSFTGKVTAVDSRVDPTTRTLNVEASLPNSGNTLRPGMALTLVLEFPGAPHPSVPSLAIQWDRQGSYVWKVDGTVVHRTAVQIITRRSGVVTVAAGLKEGDPVVTEGVLRLREGATVALAGAPAAAQGQQQPPAAQSNAAAKPPAVGEAGAAGRGRKPAAGG